MTLQQLYDVIVISETGSLNKAAEKLFVSQPALTGAVREMAAEEKYGIRQVYAQYVSLMEEYGKMEPRRTSFAVSTQHYSFAVKAFVELAKKVDVSEYELAIRETRTQEVIDDVISLRSEIGILYMNGFNRKPLTKVLNQEDLVYQHQIDCSAYVYLWKVHTLAGRETNANEDLLPYPCLAFEQGDSPLYFSEELLSTNEYPRLIRCCDRATVLNLMVGLDGYTICSGIICEELSGPDYVAVPFDPGSDPEDTTMEIGYIERKNHVRSPLGEQYIQEMQKYLLQEQEKRNTIG